jgi:hypothetical protein
MFSQIIWKVFLCSSIVLENTRISSIYGEGDAL